MTKKPYQHFYNLNGVRKPVIDWCKQYNRDYSAVLKRIKKGHPLEEIIKPRHGHSGRRTKTYAVWISMRQRCYKKSNTSYKWYGARGIKVCERWKRFENFLQDMGECPAGRQIDRIDSNGNYEPSNCRWATPSENTLNRRNTRWITFEGRMQSLTQWAKEKGIAMRTLKARIDYLGYDLKTAMRKRGKFT